MRANDYSTILAGLVAGNGSGGGRQGTAPGGLGVVGADHLDAPRRRPGRSRGGPRLARSTARSPGACATPSTTAPRSSWCRRASSASAGSSATRSPTPSQRDVVIVSGAGDVGQWPSSTANGTSYWQFPAGFPGVIGVAAVDDAGVRAPDSSDNLSVLVAAPGVRVPAGQAEGRPLSGERHPGGERHGGRGGRVDPVQIPPAARRTGRPVDVRLGRAPPRRTATTTRPASGW